MGSMTPRREAVLAEMSEVLSQYRSLLLMFEASRPVGEGTDAGFVTGAAKLDLLARTRVILNLHRADDTGYFEWHRALPAVANGAVILTEPSEDSAPLRHGVELVEAPTADLAGYLVGLLTNEDRRRAIADAAQSRLRADDSFPTALAHIVGRLQDRPLSAVVAGRATARTHTHVVVMERVRRHLQPRFGSAIPIVAPPDDTARVRFALKRTLLQQRQVLNLVTGRAPASREWAVTR